MLCWIAGQMHLLTSRCSLDSPMTFIIFLNILCTFYHNLPSRSVHDLSSEEPCEVVWKWCEGSRAGVGKECSTYFQQWTRTHTSIFVHNLKCLELMMSWMVWHHLSNPMYPLTWSSGLGWPTDCHVLISVGDLTRGCCLRWIQTVKTSSPQSGLSALTCGLSLVALNSKMVREDSRQLQQEAFSSVAWMLRHHQSFWGPKEIQTGGEMDKK